MRDVTDLPHRLREALTAARFTYDEVAELLGPLAHAALGRNETTPGLRRTRGGSPLETLVRLFLLQTPVALHAAEAALPGLVDRLAVEGLLEQSIGEVAARMDVRPYATDAERGSGGDLWVVSDLTPGLDGAPQRVGADYVLGISPASTSLAQLTLRGRVSRSLDLGTGCGVQALHLAGHSGHVVATDVNQRALWVTGFNAALNELNHLVEVREGSFFDPVQGETFDLIATNPPFVISPATGERLVYRDSGLPGDEVVRRVVTGIPEHLTDGGWGQVLANWAHVEGTPWTERVEGWLRGLGCDAWVVQREVADPAEYVELWLKDAGLHGTPDYTRRYDAWLTWFAEQRIDGVGFGWVNLRRTGREELRLEEWPYDVEQPLGPEVAAWARRTDLLHDPGDLLNRRLVVREDVRQETVGTPGAADPGVLVLRQQRGMRRARQVDTVTAAAVGACDGELTIGAILDAVAQLLDQPADRIRTELRNTLRDLVADGFLGEDLR